MHGGDLTCPAGGTLGNVYMKAQLAVKRELSKAKAPVVAHFGAAVEGIGMFQSSITFEIYSHHPDGKFQVSIRAYGAQESILLKSTTKIDEYTRANRVFNDLSKSVFPTCRD